MILDQFEEIFTLGAEWPGADAEVREALAIFVQGAIPPAIETLLDEGEAFLKHFHLDVPPLHVLLSVRQDYVFALNRWRNHLRQLGENHYELRALRGPAAFEAVFKPGELRSHHRGEVSEETKTDTGLPPLVSEETAKRIVHFVADEKEDVSLEEIEAVPPILSLLCRELNERRFTSEQPAAQITFHKGETDIETIIATFYERCLAGRPEAVRIFIEEELVSRYSSARLQQDERSILKVFADGCAIPGAARRAEGYGNPGGARACLEDLVNQRLLTAIGGGDNPSYELIHDLLAAVVEKGRTAREEQERVEKERAEERAREAATRAAVLDAALQRETEARRSADLAGRRARWLAVAAILVALIAVAAFVAALVAREEAYRQRAAAEEARAQALALLKVVSEQDYYIAHRLIREGDSNLALNYLVRSIRNDPKAELARMALGQVLLLNQNFPFKLATAPLGHKDAVYGVAFSPDGRFVLTGSSDGTARVWEAATGKPIGEPLRHEKAVYGVAFSSDGRFVLTGSGDGLSISLSTFVKMPSARVRYSGEQWRRRLMWKPRVESGQMECGYCGGRIWPGQEWDLGHSLDRRTTWPEHRPCNRATAKRRLRHSREW